MSQRQNSRWNVRAWLAAAILFLSGTAARAAAITEKELNAKFPADLGPETIDVSSYPEYQQQNYRMFQQTCSICHTLARPINAPLVTHDEWNRYVHRMHLRAKEQLVTREDGVRLVDFLVYDSQHRKLKDKKTFDAMQAQWKQRFDEIQKQKESALRSKKVPTKEPSPYTGNP